MCGVERGWGKQYARPVPIREALPRDQSLMWLTERPDRTARNDRDIGKQRETVCLKQCVYSTEFLQMVLT